MASDGVTFKDSANRWVTVGLFQETAGQNKSFILYTLDEARKLFLESHDPTGYIFAQEHLGGWQHFKALEASPALRGHIEEWKEELEAKLRAEHLLGISSLAKSGHYQAHKFMVDRGWEQNSKGRPSKAEKQKHLAREEKLRNNVSEFLRPVEK